MKAIETRYLGPTSVKCSRIKATDDDHNSVTISVNYAQSSEENQQRACRILCEKMGWTGTLIGGHTAKGMAWVWQDDKYTFTV